MRLGIMQPYFFPYIGYFQLIASVDLMLFVNDVPYIRHGFINRNRMIFNRSQSWLTLPVRQSSSNRTIEQHRVSLDSLARNKMLRKTEQSYAKAPYLFETMSILSQGLPPDQSGLAPPLLQSLNQCSLALGIKTPTLMVHATKIAPESSGEQRVIDICKHFGATEYLNLPGGQSIYSFNSFSSHGIRLGFIDPSITIYPQVNAKEFIPKLSILDLLMNVSKDERPRFTRPQGILWQDL
jgi:hypothetical protein